VSSRGGLLVSFEGIDGCGKSTQAEALCSRLVTRGLPVGAASRPGAVIREPGGTVTGEALREVLLHGPDDGVAPWTEALLYAAARAQLVAEVVTPSLAAGRILVLDRFLDSSLAYQGFARGLGIDAVFDLNRPGLQGVLPDLTFVLDVDPGVGLARVGAARDRIEREGSVFQSRVRAGFRELSARFPERVRLVDGERPPEAVAAEIEACVERLLETRHA
jgi:dTMP kinase